MPKALGYDWKISKLRPKDSSFTVLSLLRKHFPRRLRFSSSRSTRQYKTVTQSERPLAAVLTRRARVYSDVIRSAFQTENRNILCCEMNNHL